MNIGATYDVSTEDMIKRGKSVVSLVYALERIGLRTELYTDAQAKSMGSGRETAREMVKIKDAADALDPAMVMFAYAHPAFLRGMLLTAMHEHPARIQDSLKVGSAYGIPLKSLANDVFPEGCIILSTVMRSGDHSVSNVEAFVVKHLKDLGLI
ncbi:hypothetical protein EV192_106369 [Actinocrispum wychmicini]|uniref:DUF7192 domain-containing protein n=2 Tax=Actinocrispum wychmicini TaxID=1213861 RepID=A0A4R2JDA1_9PSEU|nr:hypothetical protein EV192_106369 [Actinocrispum wychmicini]